MTVLVGIDEAGFGPILGPLLVSASVFQVKPAMVRQDLWQCLRNSIAAGRKSLAGKILVCDSKKSYKRAEGLGHLQRSVLAFLAAAGRRPGTIAELVQTICPDCFGRLAEYPWYQDIAQCRLEANQIDIDIAAAMLGRDLAGNDMECLGIGGYCLDVARYNSMVANTNNKSSVLFTAVAGLIRQAFDSTDDNLQVLVDRQGGRSRYGRNLLKMFEGFELAVIEENDTCSSYEMSRLGRKMRIHFVVGADQRFMPVALASMASKYLRELLVGRINNYFLSQYPSIKPTAGYWQDGQRFIGELKEQGQIICDTARLIRCR